MLVNVLKVEYYHDNGTILGVYQELGSAQLAAQEFAAHDERWQTPLQWQPGGVLQSDPEDTTWYAYDTQADTALVISQLEVLA